MFDFLGLPWFVREHVYDLLFAHLNIRPVKSLKGQRGDLGESSPSPSADLFNICLTNSEVCAEAYERFLKISTMTIRSRDDLECIEEMLDPLDRSRVRSLRLMVEDRPSNDLLHSHDKVFDCMELDWQTLHSSFPNLQTLEFAQIPAGSKFFCPLPFDDLIERGFFNGEYEGAFAFENPWLAMSNGPELASNCFRAMGTKLYDWMMDMAVSALSSNSDMNIVLSIKFRCGSDPQYRTEDISGQLTLQDWTLRIEHNEHQHRFLQTLYEDDKWLQRLKTIQVGPSLHRQESRPQGIPVFA